MTALKYLFNLPIINHWQSGFQIIKLSQVNEKIVNLVPIYYLLNVLSRFSDIAAFWFDCKFAVFMMIGTIYNFRKKLIRPVNTFLGILYKVIHGGIDPAHSGGASGSKFGITAVTVDPQNNKCRILIAKQYSGFILICGRNATTMMSDFVRQYHSVAESTCRIYS